MTFLSIPHYFYHKQGTKNKKINPHFSTAAINIRTSVYRYRGCKWFVIFRNIKPNTYFKMALYRHKGRRNSIHTRTLAHIYVHLHTYTYTHTPTYIHWHTYIYIHTLTRIFLHTTLTHILLHTYWTLTHIHLCTNNCTYIHLPYIHTVHLHTYCTPTYIHLHTYTYIHTITHIHLHTYIYTHTPTSVV